MARTANKLTAQGVHAAKPASRQYKRSDGQGLYLLVTPSGGKHWRLKYRFGGKEKTLALGSFPEVPLASRNEGGRWVRGARELRDEAKSLLAQGIDPNEWRREQQRQQAQSVRNTFRAVAEEWLTKVHSCEVSENHYARNRRRMELYLYPKLGSRPISEIKAPELLEALREIQAKGSIETGHRVKTLAGKVFRYGIALGQTDRDITADLKGQLISKKKDKHLPAITDPEEMPELLRAIDRYKGYQATRYALKLAALLFMRPGELRTATWDQINFERAEWHMTASKTDEPIIIPLPRQATAMLRELWQLTGNREHLFPSVRNPRKPMSDGTLNTALKRLGFDGKMTAHGFRAMARTVLEERLDFRPEYIEQQLAHRVRDPLGRAYNRTKHLEQRRQMLQTWADYLDKLQDDACVIPIDQGSGTMFFYG